MAEEVAVVCRGDRCVVVSGAAAGEWRIFVDRQDKGSTAGKERMRKCDAMLRVSIKESG